MILWTVACQAPLSMGFFRQEYWRGLPCPPPGDLPYPGIQACLHSCIERQGFFLFCFVLPLAPPGKRKANPGIASGVRLNWPGSNQFPPTSSVHFQRQKLELMKITYSSKWSLIEVGSVLYITGRDEPGTPPSHGHSGGGSLSWQKLKERRQLSKQLGREQWILFEGLNRGWNFLFSVLKGSQFPS